MEPPMSAAMNEDFLDLLSALNDAEVRYLVVGGYAVGIQGGRARRRISTFGSRPA
jgi:hypothetical protein